MLGQLKDTAMDLLKKNNPGQGDAGSSVKDGVNNFLGGNSGGGAGAIANKLGNKLGLGGDSSGGLGGAFGDLFGGGDDGGAGKIENPFAKKESAKGTPQKLFENKKAATANLLSKEAEPPPEGTFMDETSTMGEASSFGTTHIRPWVRNEFKRREQNFGMYYTQAGEFADNAYQVMQNSSTFDASYNDTIYRGPKSAWMRVISNSIGKHPDTDKEIYGFELQGFNDFHEIYGFNPKTGQGDGETYLGKGWDSGEKGAGEVRHTIKEEDFKHKPSPGVTEITSEDKEPGKNFRETTVKFLVHSRNQLDYLDDYFFKLGSTCVVEWGWNTYPREGVVIDPTDMGSPMEKKTGKQVKSKGLLTAVNNLRKEDENKDALASGDIDETVKYRTKNGSGLAGLFTDPVLAAKHMKKGKGNYSFVIGMISNYSYNIRDDGGYDCEIKVTTMAAMASGLNNEATKIKKESADVADKQKDFKLFVATKLDEILEGDSPNDFLDNVTDMFTDNRKNAETIEGMARGRFYQFDQSISGKETYHSDHEDAYITIGFFIDIVNFFFGKTSEDTNIPVYTFEVSNSRCVAHPNIKSTDGKVLLIPNRMSPRRNGKASGSVASKALSEIKSMLSNSMDSESVIKVINSEKGKGSKLSSLDQALQTSPRDDLYDILSQRAQKGNFTDAVNPFPDFKKVNDKPTQGYSGRIQDLFVNYNVIRDAVENGSDIRQIIKEILKKVSDAAGGVWDFDLVAADTGAPNNTKVQIVDRRFPGMVTAYDIQKEDQLFRFKSHTKNSIVKNLSLDVAVASEVAGQVLFQDSSDEDKDTSEEDADNNPQSTFYARGRNDRLLKKCSSPTKDKPSASQGNGKKEDEDDDIESEEKFIVDGGGSDVEMVDPNKNRMVKSMKFDNNKLNCVKNNMPLDGCQISLTLDGIEGLRLLDVFTCTGVPTHYFINGHWRIQSVTHTISDNNWITDISGEYIPSTKTS